jgi:FlaA1/EpsC-like NDP-sugar epimerase
MGKTGLYYQMIRFRNDILNLTLLRNISIVALIYLVFLIQNVSLNSSFQSSIGFLALSYFFLTLSRLAIKKIYSRKYFSNENKGVLIYGAGDAGIQLAMSLAHSMEYQVFGFIDDDKKNQGLKIFGYTVYTFDEVKNKLSEMKIHQILLAIPSLNHKTRLTILNKLSKLDIKVLTIPSIAEIEAGQRISKLQDIEPADLIDRSEVAPNLDFIRSSLKGKNILITGAGGTIGSEIALKCLQNNAKKIILFDVSEYLVYEVDQKLQALKKKNQLLTEINPVLGSVIDYKTNLRLIRDEDIDIIYHAAAYKHVPLVEMNPFQGVLVNVLGSYRMALAASRCKVERFVLISSDKAVRPTNVMGASKRLAELAIKAIGEKSNSTLFTMVRFGNVFGSSGSVIPLFVKQINMGGPLTITDRNITRYFMSISEAVELVIQAGFIAKGNEVMLLKMGKPVKILELAKRMINFSGKGLKSSKNPDGIEIQYTGLRPGEKLYEELLIDPNSAPTSHPDIFYSNDQSLSHKEFVKIIESLERCIEEQDKKILQSILSKYVDGYSPVSSQVDRKVIKFSNRLKEVV